jgi:uncharacterized membrane protein YidH (DUF202 family)
MTNVPAGDKPGPMWSGASGASTERTRLAWRRTALASTAIVLLTVRLAIRDRFTVFGAIVIAAAVVLWLAQMRLTERRIDAIDRNESTHVVRALPGLSLTVIGFSLLAIIAALIR